MKTTRLCIGIISMVLFLLIIFQSCVAGIGGAFSEKENSGAAAGTFVAWIMLIAGIIGVCSRRYTIGAYITAGFYTLAGIIGVSAFNSFFAELVVWGIVNFIFAIVFVCAGIVNKKAPPLTTAPTPADSPEKETKL